MSQKLRDKTLVPVIFSQTSTASENRMVEPLEAAAEACFTDDLLLLDFPSADATPTAGGGTDQQHPSLQDIFDPAIESIPVEHHNAPPGPDPFHFIASKEWKLLFCVHLLSQGLEGGGGQASPAEEEEEEELEWLSNKDAFPALETSFEVPASRRPNPVSVLATASPPLRVPVRARSKGRRRSRQVLPVFPPSPARKRRKCLHCEAEDTPQWRAGPEGPRTLCNACGVRFKSGRLVPEYRPASSPTFSVLLHSNSHRRILEMRRGIGAVPRGQRCSPSMPSLPAAAGPAL